MMVTPHLKTVLKDYQHSAVKSLHGPAHHLHPPFAPPAAAPAGPYEEGGACSPAAASAAAAYVPPLPVQQLPILTTSDTSSSELTFTRLEDVPIACFSVGGEKRLCLPQVLQSVLGDFTLAQINNQCDNLLIYCSRCTPEQLNVLKGQLILPSSAFSCGLITKSDAERLCSALLHSRAKPAARVKKEPAAPSAYADGNEAHSPKAATAASAVKSEDGEMDHRPTAAVNGARARPASRGGRVFRVRHECFGRAVGLLHEALYDAKQAKCIECVECRGWHSPQQFVKHVHWQHARGESHTVHWGFDSAKWRHYLLPLVDAADECCGRADTDETDADRVLDLMRDRYEGVAPFVAHDGGVSEKAEIKKEANGKEWNMSLKRKLLLQQGFKTSSTTPPPRPPPSPPPIKRDSSSPLFPSKKAKLSGEDYIYMGQPYLQPMDSYLPPAVFQQLSLSFQYPSLPSHALSLGVGHQSAKEAKLRQAIAESNSDLARLPHAADDVPLPPTPKKRLIRHMQEQRRKLEEVQKSPDSTTVLAAPVASVELKYSEIDLSTTDTEDTASEGTAHSDPPKAAALPPEGEPAEPTRASPSPECPEMRRLLAFLATHPHPDKRHIVDLFRGLLDERAARDERIRELEAQAIVLQRPPSRERAADAPATSPGTDRTGETAGCVENESVQNDYQKSVITSPTRLSLENEAISKVGCEAAAGDAATSTSDGDDANSHCPPSASTPAAT